MRLQREKSILYPSEKHESFLTLNLIRANVELMIRPRCKWLKALLSAPQCPCHPSTSPDGLAQGSIVKRLTMNQNQNCPNELNQNKGMLCSSSLPRCPNMECRSYSGGSCRSRTVGFSSASAIFHFPADAVVLL